MKKNSILVIEDDNSTRMLLGYLLSKKYEVFMKEDGFAAIMWLDSGNLPDLIILDMSMPRINGYDFLMQIRKSGFYRDIPVIIVSGIDNSEEVARFKKFGRCEFIQKPFNPLQLHQKTSNVFTQVNQYSYV